MGCVVFTTMILCLSRLLSAPINAGSAPLDRTITGIGAYTSGSGRHGSAAYLPGDFVECGTNRGFLSSAIMEYLDWNKCGRRFYLLDTFNGVDERYVSAEEKRDGVLDRARRDLETAFYTTDVDMVRANFAEWEKVSIIVGAVPET